MLKKNLKGVGLYLPAVKARDFFQHQFSVARCKMSGVTNGFPVPSRRLTHLVSGHEDVYVSLRNGRYAAKSIVDALAKNGLVMDQLEKILDFGCGSGRVIRNFHKLGKRMHGSDYNSELLDYCSKTFPFAQFLLNELDPPTRWPDCEFDLVYLLSVFTHLSGEAQHSWLREFQRIIKPGGFLLFSTQGERFAERLLEGEQRKQFSKGELVIKQTAIEGENEYGAFHPRAYIETVLSKSEGWSLMDFIPNGAFGNGGQDFVLFQKLGEG